MLLERAVRQAVLSFEPRILPDSLAVSVRIEPEQMDRHAMLFVIEGKLWAQPLPLSLYLETELDLETGTVTVAEAAR
jgi:type VI secretion system protein ImpF